ncbi:MAG TPA: hypothetical protein VE961_19885 [Pyrinomonadaceae bacterium]|nr:hypothetical protein [Pyrinomonadaceae bacterium]
MPFWIEYLMDYMLVNTSKSVFGDQCVRTDYTYYNTVSGEFWTVSSLDCP